MVKSFSNQMCLPLRVKMEPFPILLPDGQVVSSDGSEVKSYNNFFCSRTKNPTDKSLKYQFCLFSGHIPRDLEAQCLKLAKYLAEEVIPPILEKYPRAENVPVVTHYRIRCMLENFTYYWMFVMVLPEEVGINFIDLFRVRQNAGPWNAYVIGCG